MNIQETKNTKRKLAITVTSACLVAVIGISAVAFMHGKSYAVAETQTDSVPTKSLFTFTGTNDWRKGPSNETSMALFSKAAADGTSSCFTSVEYKLGTVDETAELQKNSDTLVKGGHTVAPIGTQSLALQTLTGTKNYELHQFKVTSPNDKDKLMGGNELGYLQLSDGYVKILGNCNSSSELPTTLSALQAIKLEK